jgi:RecJ-like exonuclease
MSGHILYTGDEEITLPTKWEICGCCEGKGSSSRYLGAFTSSEWEEQDQDFRDDYIAGHYDRQCDECRGSGKVQVVDESQLTPEQLKAWQDQCQDDADYEAICAAERRMGA